MRIVRRIPANVGRFYLLGCRRLDGPNTTGPPKAGCAYVHATMETRAYGAAPRVCQVVAYLTFRMRLTDRNRTGGPVFPRNASEVFRDMRLAAQYFPGNPHGGPRVAIRITLGAPWGPFPGNPPPAKQPVHPRTHRGFELLAAGGPHRRAENPPGGLVGRPNSLGRGRRRLGPFC